MCYTPKPKPLPDIGTRVYFGERNARVVGYSTLKRIGPRTEVTTYLVVELSPESSGYVTKAGQDQRDYSVSLVLLHPESVEGVTTDGR